MHEFNSYEEEELKKSHFQFKNKNEKYKLPYPKRYKAVKITGSGSNHEFVEKIKVYSIDYPNETLVIGGIDEIMVNKKIFTDLQNLLEELNKILFKKGGGRVSENNGTAASGTLAELRAGVSTTSVLWSPLVLSTWLNETINHQEEDPLKIYQEELLKK